ncbi:MAG: cobalamin B12-binding domain-containing protein [Gammaproteobacteria bacterium]|uniref:cobalamin B12-binding domain-containing protein n=1 Tax=Rhodoferax sp. TaxID=50421 RepID=UPI00185D681D|nr:cobalamin B12-binding domain-containing protein [Rhodoferax sp.]MBU3899872.1 cobalamin B12-binding domain-containing protein [Gammaproteobacteria bacterium]MBA3058628.1 cobalamin B12-binding domain-containing protein [Rhodoferax sp.]MBU3996055.1 cobalamin B12-binding domain-containing protein [Gammaproteobacteria bacterium]MBU4019137.1 cobalamin B12-binding domain-containing protein [Gammaproteobacteria bacterium]MBU4078855.1 cobalamin B12-binding domain-containing protein [Gammaproteobacte
MCDKPDYLMQPAGITRFLALREDAVRYVLDANVRAYPEVYARFGPRGREACAEDVGYHLDFLRPTLESGDLSPFVSYLAWLSQVLSSRNVPTESLLRSLDDLATFFAPQLGASAAPLLAALADGKAALLGGLAPPAYDKPCPDPWQEAAPFCEATLHGQRKEASTLFNEAIARGDSLTQASVHVIQPALYDVGRQWQENKVSVAQEHLATAMAQTLMAQGMGRASAKPDNGLRALFACMTGNHHVIGLRMVADAFELEGWRVDYLGANTPLPALLAQVRETRPQLVGLSVSLPQQLRTVRETIATLKATFGADCPRLAVGGLVFNQFPRLAESLGAELLGADAHSAAQAAHAALHSA